MSHFANPKISAFLEAVHDAYKEHFHLKLCKKIFFLLQLWLNTIVFFFFFVTADSWALEHSFIVMDLEKPLLSLPKDAWDGFFSVQVTIEGSGFLFFQSLYGWLLYIANLKHRCFFKYAKWKVEYEAVSSFLFCADQFCFLKDLFFLVMCMCVCVCAHECSTHRGQKRVSDPMALKLQKVCEPPRGCCDLTSRSYTRVASALNHQAISPALQSCFLFYFE